MHLFYGERESSHRDAKVSKRSKWGCCNYMEQLLFLCWNFVRKDLT